MKTFLLTLSLLVAAIAAAQPRYVGRFFGDSLGVSNAVGIAPGSAITITTNSTRLFTILTPALTNSDTRAVTLNSNLMVLKTTQTSDLLVTNNARINNKMSFGFPNPVAAIHLSDETDIAWSPIGDTTTLYMGFEYENTNQALRVMGCTNVFGTWTTELMAITKAEGIQGRP